MGPGRMLHNAFGSLRTDDLLTLFKSAEAGNPVANLSGVMQELNKRGGELAQTGNTISSDRLRRIILSRQQGDEGKNILPFVEELERRKEFNLSSAPTEASLRAELVSKVEDPKVLEGLSNEDLYAGTQLSLERREGSVSLIAEMEKRRGAPLGGGTQPLLPSRNEFLGETTTRPLSEQEQKIVDDLLKDGEVKPGFPLAEGDSRSFDEILDLNSMGARPPEVKPKPSRDPLGQAYSDFSQRKRRCTKPSNVR